MGHMSDATFRWLALPSAASALGNRMLRKSRRLAPPLLFLLLLAAGPTPAATLEDALAGALARATAGEQPAPGEASTWLAAVPTLTASYIESTEALGTDEAEISLNLPIKGAARRRLDGELETLETQSVEANARYRRWVYSGLVRERAWAQQLATLDLKAARDKQALLARLAARFARQAESGAIPLYSSLIVERARLDAELAVDAARLAVEREREAFTALTGLAEVPGDLTETAPEAPAYGDHPALRRLQLARARERAVLGLSAPDTASWNLSLVARSFQGPEFTDDSLGVALEAPLNFLGTQSSSNRSQRQAAQRDYVLARDQLWLELRDRWRTLVAEREQLQRRQTLLQRAAELADRIETQVSALETSNEIEGEIRLQRMLDVLDTRAALARANALAQRTIARQRQAAGRPL